MRPSFGSGAEFSAQDLPRTRGTWRLALAFALAALFAGVMLTGVSAWFLGAVALAGAGPAAFTFNFHVPGALVRLFALTRTVAKYGERVVGHKAALLDQVRRRSALFSAMAASPTTRSAGWQLADQDRLSDFIDDVEDVDYARLRIGLPLKSLLAGLGFLAIATLVLAPLAMLPIMSILGATAFLAGRLLPRTRSLWGRVRAERRAAARQFGMALASSVPLRAERRWTEMLDAGFDRLAAAEAGRLSSRRDLAILDTAAGAFGPLAAACVLGTAWVLGYRGEALLPAGLIAFAWLALGETVQGVSRILVARVKEEEARHGIREWTAGSHASSGEPSSTPAAVATLELLRLPLVAPDGRRLGGTVHLDLQPGRPVVLAGPSGCGKTSLLKQVAGWLATPRGGQVLGDGSSLPRAGGCSISGCTTPPSWPTPYVRTCSRRTPATRNAGMRWRRSNSTAGCARPEGSTPGFGRTWCRSAKRSGSISPARCSARSPSSCSTSRPSISTAGRRRASWTG